MDKLAEKGNWKGIRRLQLLGGPSVVVLVRCIPVFVIAYFGSEYIQILIDSLPTWAMNGLSATGKLLPALGMSMLMKFMWKKELAIFFVLGFTVAAYSGMTDLLLYAILGTVLAVVLLKLGFQAKPKEVE